MGLQNWSTTPANNATGAPNINMQTGSAPSTVHPSVRQMMADVAAWYALPEWVVQADTPTYTGATTFTLPGDRTGTYSVGRRILAEGTTGSGYALTGTITGSAYTTVTTVTVQWDTGSLDATVYVVAVGILQNQLVWIEAQLSALTPAGTLIDFAGTSAPSGYLACDGSAVSRTTYAALFAAISTIWGAGDGSTTFNLPNLQRCATIGAGGTAVSGPANTVGSVGGEETHTLSTAELAAHNHGITDPGHVHGVNDPGHYHAQGEAATAYAGRFGQTGSLASTTALAASAYNGTGTVGNNTSTDATGISIASNGTGTSIALNGSGISILNNGSGAAHNNMQPSAVVLKCIKY